MKKILFIMQWYPTVKSANSICDERIIESLKKNKIEISCLTYWIFRLELNRDFVMHVPPIHSKCTTRRSLDLSHLWTTVSLKMYQLKRYRIQWRFDILFFLSGSHRLISFDTDGCWFGYNTIQNRICQCPASQSFVPWFTGELGAEYCPFWSISSFHDF